MKAIERAGEMGVGRGNGGGLETTKQGMSELQINYFSERISKANFKILYDFEVVLNVCCFKIYF